MSESKRKSHSLAETEDIICSLSSGPHLLSLDVCPDHMANPPWHLETVFQQLWEMGGTALNSVVLLSSALSPLSVSKLDLHFNYFGGK